MLSDRRIFFDHLAQTSEIPLALEIESASGSWLYTSGGKKYLDLIAGVSVSNLGHNNREVVEAVRKQAELYMHLMVYGEYIQNPQVRLAELLCSRLPPNLNNIYYTNSGSEAVEGAVKLSRRYTGRHEVVAFKNSYHGSTTGALSLTGNESLKRAFRPLLPSIRHLTFNDHGSIEQISRDTAAVFAEPIQGEAGVILPEVDFLHKLRERCNKTGALLVFDEIQTGFGRTGELFAIDLFKVNPDIILFAKGFGGGMPLGAFVSSRAIMDSLSRNPQLGHITTFGGHPVSCAAGYASLKYIIDKAVTDNVKTAGQLFRQLLVHPSIKEVRGTGLMMAVDLGCATKVKRLVRDLLDRGLITEWFLFNDKSFRISPPLTVTEDEVRYACRVINESLDYIN